MATTPSFPGWDTTPSLTSDTPLYGQDNSAVSSALGALQQMKTQLQQTPLQNYTDFNNQNLVDAQTAIAAFNASKQDAQTATASSALPSTSNDLPTAPNPAGGLIGGQNSVTTNPVNNSGSISGLSVARIASGIVGIICIGVGLLMFKQTQVVISAATKTAAKVAMA